MELKAKKCGEVFWMHSAGTSVYTADEADRYIVHQKMKRCETMAKWCNTKGDWYYGISESFRDRVEFYIKWQKRWLELAKKFKAAK